jgi:prevent-host-death family protein
MSSKRIEIGIEPARADLRNLIRAADAGTDVILTFHRKPVARIIPYQENGMFTVTFDTAEQAEFFAGVFAGNTYERSIDIEGTTVYLSQAALNWLIEEQPSGDDGCYENGQIWITGTGYPVNAPTS